MGGCLIRDARALQVGAGVLLRTCQASALDPAAPVTVTVDLGGQKKLRSADILWEFPAKSFALSVTTDGVKWSEVFATDSNVLSTTSIPLGAVPASKVRIVMHEVLARVVFLLRRHVRCTDPTCRAGALNGWILPGPSRVWHKDIVALCPPSAQQH